MTKFRLKEGDCLEVMKPIPDNSFHSVVTDPPYGLSFMGKDWDHGIPGKIFWEEILRVSKPGAHLLAFGGTRTHHRLMVAIEDAGWEVRDCLMWLYGSGFPKSLDISKAIDKAAGVEREVIGYHKQSIPQISPRDNFGSRFGDEGGNNTITVPATDEAKEWDGWGTALKPAFEPILLCRKPLTIVPFDGTMIAETQTLIGGLLCQLLSSVNNAEGISRLSPSVSGEASVSALMIVAVLHGAKSGELYGLTDTCNSREMASTCLSIALSWSNILDALYSRANTFTTSTVTSLTTALRTLNCLLSEIIPESTTQVASRLLGSSSSATIAEKSLNGVKPSMSAIQSAFAAALVSLPRSESQSDAKNVDATLLPIIRAAASVLSHVLLQPTIESEKKLSPNWEPIILARKPVEGTIAENILKYGVGGINIDGTRIALESGANLARNNKPGDNGWKNSSGGPNNAALHGVSGRWPANLLLDEEAGEMLDEQTGTLISNGGKGPHTIQATENRNTKRVAYSDYGASEDKVYGDSGGASRFFYVSKASKKDRGENNNHPTVKPTGLLRYLCRLVTPPNGIVFDPFMGSASTGKAALLESFRFYGIEKEKNYFEIAEKRIQEVISQLGL